MALRARHLLQTRGVIEFRILGPVEAVGIANQRLVAMDEQGVTFRTKDGKSVTVPNADILVFDGDLVSDWQIYIDVAPVYA